MLIRRDVIKIKLFLLIFGGIFLILLIIADTTHSKSDSFPKWFFCNNEYPSSSENISIDGVEYKCWHISEQGLNYPYCGQGDGRDAWVRIGAKGYYGIYE